MIIKLVVSFGISKEVRRDYMIDVVNCFRLKRNCTSSQQVNYVQVPVISLESVNRRRSFQCIRILICTSTNIFINESPCQVLESKPNYWLRRMKYEKRLLLRCIHHFKDPGTALMETKPIQLNTNENRL